MTVAIVLQIIAATVTVFAIWQTGNKNLWGPSLYLVSDVCFIAVNAYAGLWILVTFILFVMVLHTRNLLKWKREI